MNLELTNEEAQVLAEVINAGVSKIGVELSQSGLQGAKRGGVLLIHTDAIVNKLAKLLQEASVVRATGEEEKVAKSATKKEGAA